jgi:DNA modification methylase
MAKEIKITCKAADGMALDELYEFQGELKTISDDELEKLKKSIVKYGFSFPIFVWKSKVLDGHQRLKAVKQLVFDGYKIKGNKLPVVRIEAKNEKEAAEKLLLINSRYAKIDEGGFQVFTSEFDLDLNEMTELIELPEIDFSFGDDEDYQGLTDPDEVPEVEETPVSKTGDIWLLGDHRLMCGDSTEEDDVKKLMNGEKADMVFTDPPYGIDLDTDYKKSYNNFTEKIKISNNFKKIQNDNKNFDAFFILDYFKDVKEIFLWGANNYIDTIENYKNGSWICWDKKNIQELYNVKSSDFELAWSKNRHKYTMFKITWNGMIGHDKKLDGKSKIHPTQKSVKLFIEIFNKSWCKDLNLIVDLYSGSGTTIIAAEQTKRRCFAMEISPQYVDVAVKRWQDFIGKDAVLESNSKNFNTVSSSLVIVT